MSKSQPEQALAVAAAMLLVASAVGVAPSASPVGTASATHDCSTLEETLTFALGTTGQVVDKTLRDGKCTESHRAEAIDDLNEANAEQERLDIYNAALQQRAETQTQNAVLDNYLNDSQSVAWMKAEIAIAEAYQNGSSKAVAKSKAKQAIADYYATKQANLNERWMISLTSYRALLETAENQSNITQRPMSGGADAVGAVNATGQNPDPSFVGITGTQQSHDGGYRGPGLKSFPNGTVTLVNGSAEETLDIKTGRIDYPGGTHYTTTTFDITTGSGEIATGVSWGEFVVEAPNEYSDRITYMDPDKFAERWSHIETLNNDLQAEVDPFVNSTWTAYESGQINSSDVLSRNTQMFEYGVDATNDSSRNLYNVVAALSSMGLDTPSIAGAGTMEVSYAGTTYDGLVMAREAPNGSWSSGTTYNTSDIDGVVMLATTGGSQINMEGEFTVEAINAEDGSSVEQVSATKVVYKTANTSEQLQKMQKISDLRAQVEAYKSRIEAGTGGGDGGGDDDGLALPDWVPGGWSGLLAGLLGGGGLLLGGTVVVVVVALLLVARVVL